MKRPRWIDPRAIVLLHGETLAEHGGVSGVRDSGILESALARPQHLNYYEPDSDPAKLAAAYGYGIVLGHPFVDGNKRVGFLAIGLFLSLSGVKFHADPMDSVETILRLAAGDLTEKALAGWIRENI